MNLYVSPNGNDAWSGRKAGPNRAQSDGPFATLERARDAVRSLKSSGGLPKGGVTVWLRGGVYPRTASFELTARDSGTSSAPVTYRPYRKEEARLVGGKEISAFEPVTDPAVLARLDPVGREKIVQADLRAAGIEDFGKLTGRGFGRAIMPSALELFFQDRPMQLARWPNGSWATIAAAPAGQKGGRFSYKEDRPSRWLKTGDVWVHGYWTYDWADTYERIKSIDPQARVIATHEPHGVYGYTAGKRWYALNILEELDEPGEYYADRETGILYFWPPVPVGQGKAVASLLEKPLIALKGASHITLRGLTLECSRGSGVEISGGSHNLVAGCLLRNLGTVAVNIEGGTENGVQGCDIFDTGEGGISLSGGDRKTLTPGHNFSVNNILTRFNRWSKTCRPGVAVNGVGNRVAHCRIYDVPHNAILMGGNEHIIEYNEIHDVCKETGDAGAFYMGRDFTQRGNIVRYNYFHDLRAGGLEGQQGFTDVMAVYLDDCLSGTTVYGNIFYKAGRAVMIGGGRDNTVENNIFVECSPSIHVDARGLGWASFWFDGRDSTLMDGLKAIHYKQPPYSARYPELPGILEDEPAVPKGNKIIRNISAGGKWIDLYDNLTDKTILLKNNLTDGDPGFVDASIQDFRLKKDSPAWKLGFKAIPVEKIGLLKDKYRAVVK
ncbi:MAG: right-handed parallel beta-helix repeat-containing protein [Armatimonadetes bacterium]|nr:right-handed parallel beta-helix repeat-containing protein [Armatimonadota bacterium]